MGRIVLIGCLGVTAFNLVENGGEGLVPGHFYRLAINGRHSEGMTDFRRPVVGAEIDRGGRRQGELEIAELCGYVRSGNMRQPSKLINPVGTRDIRVRGRQIQLLSQRP